MYVDTSYSKQWGKTYCRHLLRESYREKGKVKHRTLANLSHCTEEEIAAIKLALKYKGNLIELGTLEDIDTKQGMRVGAIFTLNAIAERIGFSCEIVVGAERMADVKPAKVKTRESIVIMKK